MNKLILLGIAATLGAAKLAFFPANPPVDLQPTSPGTAQAGHLNITGTATVGQLKSAGTVFGASAAPTGVAYGGYFTAASNQGRGFYGFASSLTGATYGGVFQNASDQGRAVYGLATSATGTTYGGYFQSSSPSGRAVYGLATSSTGFPAGVYGRSSSPTGFGVYSNGNLAVANGTITGNGSGITDLNASQITTGTLDTARLPNPLSLSGDNVNAIVQGQNSNSGGYGVTGYASSNTGTTYGVYGISSSNSGRGVVGYATHAGGVNYGVLGQTNSSFGWGVYALGDLGASGTKAFRIDHPLDPEKKYLLHYASESPYPQNFYNGTVVTDSHGYAWVQLPDYFDEINKNFRYQLTVLDDQDSRGFVMAKVSKLIVGNRFQVRTSEPRTTVSWEVKADRNDLYVRNRPPRDVVEKEGLERGTYQHPELYGLGPERGINYHPEGNPQLTNRPPQKR